VAAVNFEIKHRFSDTVLFALETESFKLCVEAAVKSRANLLCADLSGTDLSGTDLSYANLSGADLSGADLIDANLRGAALRSANLIDANLRGAYLRYADLSGAYLRYADLSGADLSGADLSGANLRGANLRGANGEKLTLVGARPFLQIGPFGSRHDYLQAWLTDGGIYVRAGCFWNTLSAFTKAVKETHGTSVHAKEYAAAIAMIKAYAKLWTPKKAKGASVARSPAQGGSK
jgi:hypothetical protein